jgi:hypothetical protein
LIGKIDALEPIVEVVSGGLGVAVAIGGGDPTSVDVVSVDGAVELSELPAVGGLLELAVLVGRDGPLVGAVEIDIEEFAEGGPLRQEPDVGIIGIGDDALGVVVGPIPSEGGVPVGGLGVLGMSGSSGLVEEAGPRSGPWESEARSAAAGRGGSSAIAVTFKIVVASVSFFGSLWKLPRLWKSLEAISTAAWKTGTTLDSFDVYRLRTLSHFHPGHDFDVPVSHSSHRLGDGFISSSFFRKPIFRQLPMPTVGPISPCAE